MQGRALRRILGAVLGACVCVGAWLADTTRARAADPILHALHAIRPETRAAAHALRRGDVQRAGLALRRIEIFWHEQLSSVPRIRLDNEPALQRAMAAFDQNLAVTGALIALGDLAGATDRLRDLTLPFATWRAARRVPLLADCLDQFVTIWERLLEPDGTGRERAAFALTAQIVLDRCDAAAPARARRDPAFTDLVERFRQSFGGLHRAIANGDARAYERALRDQQSLERSILLRFG